MADASMRIRAGLLAAGWCLALAVPVGAETQPALPGTAGGDEFTAVREQILTHVQREDLNPAEVHDWIGFAERIKETVKQDLSISGRLKRALKNPWVAFGFLAQGTFMMRFVLQIIASERKKKSYVPVAFWYLSLAGGLMLFTYALHLRDPVFVFGQGLGLFIYLRNLILIYRRRGDLNNRLAEREQRSHAAGASPGAE